MEPVLAVYAGYSLRGEHVEPGAKLQPFVQEALDEIEYVTGGAETTWGKERAKDGHPEPFKIQYVEIGNEDAFDRSGSYDGRFAQFYDAIKAKYPDLQIIATAPVKGRKPDVLDEHFYRSARQMERDVRHYDKYDRNGPKIFVGEWATRDGNVTPTLNAALGDAAWMIGMERNADVVVMHCYAPLLVNVSPGAKQWDTDLIGYDAQSSFGSAVLLRAKNVQREPGRPGAAGGRRAAGRVPGQPARAAGRRRGGDLAHPGGVQGPQGDARRQGAVPGRLLQGAEGLASRPGRVEGRGRGPAPVERQGGLPDHDRERGLDRLHLQPQGPEDWTGPKGSGWSSISRTRAITPCGTSAGRTTRGRRWSSYATGKRNRRTRARR